MKTYNEIHRDKSRIKSQLEGCTTLAQLTKLTQDAIDENNQPKVELKKNQVKAIQKLDVAITALIKSKTELFGGILPTSTDGILPNPFELLPNPVAADDLNTAALIADFYADATPAATVAPAATSATSTKPARVHNAHKTTAVASPAPTVSAVVATPVRPVTPDATAKKATNAPQRAVTPDSPVAASSSSSTTTSVSASATPAKPAVVKATATPAAVVTAAPAAASTTTASATPAKPAVVKATTTPAAVVTAASTTTTSATPAKPAVVKATTTPAAVVTAAPGTTTVGATPATGASAPAATPKIKTKCGTKPPGVKSPARAAVSSTTTVTADPLLTTGCTKPPVVIIPSTVASRTLEVAKGMEALKALTAKRAEYDAEFAATQDTKYQEASNAVERINHKLNDFSARYIDGSIDKARFSNLTKNVLSEANPDVQTLNTHRGIKQLLVNIATAFGLLGVFYAIAALATKSWTIFGVSTDAGSKLNDIKDAFENVSAPTA